MLLKQAITEIAGLKYMTDLLQIRSSAGRRYLNELPFLTDIKTLEKIMQENELVLNKYSNPQFTNDFAILETKIGQLRDIKTTLKQLSDRHVANDVELFEIKYFAILSESVREIVLKIDLQHIVLPDLIPVIDILDPEKKRIPHFHIYDQYSFELAEIRKKMTSATDVEKEESLYIESEKIEVEIRRNLSEKLRLYVTDMIIALNTLSYLDVSLAKAEQALKMELVKPFFTQKITWLKSVYHPQVADALKQQGKVFQKIDIAIPDEPTLITGANMAGKSVLLKTVGLIQFLAQFGFYVPAASAQIVPVEQIFLSVGDGQDELNGLSSFASEMLKINQIVKWVKNKTSTLILIDELARTTNPVEGNAIVCGVLDYLIENKVRSLITTHYAIDLKCRRLRVKGFIEKSNITIVNSQNINNFIDYSLEETSENHVPHEAIRVAEIIGVEDVLIKRMNGFLGHPK